MSDHVDSSLSNPPPPIFSEDEQCSGFRGLQGPHTLQGLNEQPHYSNDIIDIREEHARRDQDMMQQFDEEPYPSMRDFRENIEIQGHRLQGEGDNQGQGQREQVGIPNTMPAGLGRGNRIETVGSNSPQRPQNLGYNTFQGQRIQQTEIPTTTAVEEQTQQRNNYNVSPQSATENPGFNLRQGQRMPTSRSESNSSTSTLTTSVSPTRNLSPSISPPL